MQRFQKYTRIKSFLVLSLLPLYALLTYSLLLCTFHHIHHHNMAGHAGHGQVPESEHNFCKYAQSVTPVIAADSQPVEVSLQTIASVHPFIPLLTGRPAGEKTRSRAPPGPIFG